MKYEIGRRFAKETEKLSDDLQREIYTIIQQVESARSLDDIGNVKKLKGFKNAFRIRVGGYRIGLLLDGDTVTFSRVLNRKDIYKYFP